MPYVSACKRGLRANLLACQRGLRANVFVCQRGLRTNVLKACQHLIFTYQRANTRVNMPTTCQRAKRRANFSTWRANVLRDAPIFQIFLLRNAKENYYTLLLYKIFYIILDIKVIHICICIVHKNCIIIHFYTSCHIKEKCVEFFFFLFCSSVRTRRFYLTGDMTNLCPFIQGLLEWPFSELFSANVSL